MRIIDLQGNYQVTLKDNRTYSAVLPGTLDTNQIGSQDIGANKWHPEAGIGSNEGLVSENRILTRLTRKHIYEGAARFSRDITFKKAEDERVFLEVERSRELSLFVNDIEVAQALQGTLSTPHIFEVSDAMINGENHMVLVCDNSYPSWPHDAIVYSSAATDETQTNWNGLLGYIRLRTEMINFISEICIYPTLTTATVMIEIDCKRACQDTLMIQSEAFKKAIHKEILLSAGIHRVIIENIELDKKVKYWDEDEGNLYSVTVCGNVIEEKKVRFGVRSFGNCKGRLALNNRPIFLRSEANCCLFPETGHMPMTVNEWKTVLGIYHSYGVNCMRFHSHCPPSAAFTAADEMGIMMQVELSHWNPKSAFEDDKSYHYYRLELQQILRSYANHPSFVMLTFGNELAAGALGHKRMDVLLQMAKEMDSTRLYASGSNNHYGKTGTDLQSDFYTATNYYDLKIRGTCSDMTGYINEEYPSAATHFDKEMSLLRKEFSKPVFSFEVGQYEILPDFDELANYKGITTPDNIVYIKECVEKKGLLPDWKRRVEATGELALLAYREEVEAILRTKEMSGISLLGLQDFTGQGTALVGMLNAHLQPKPFSFANPERFVRFFTPILPLALLKKYTYYCNESIQAKIQLANYGKTDIVEKGMVSLIEGETVIMEQALPRVRAPYGALSDIGEISLILPATQKAMRLTLKITIGSYENTYPIWVYPESKRMSLMDVIVTSHVQEAKMLLKQGKTVLLDPISSEEHFPHSIQAQFTTDFWSVGTFSSQSGFMGCYLDSEHSAFKLFPTENYSNWQWWPMCKGRAFILPGNKQAIVVAMDCYARMRNMGLLLEANVFGGRLLLSSMNLLENSHYPEVNAMLESLCSYAASSEFVPNQILSEEEFDFLVR